MFPYILLRKVCLSNEVLGPCLACFFAKAKDLQLLIQYVDVDEDGFLTLSEFLELIQQTLGQIGQGFISRFISRFAGGFAGC